MSIDEEVAALFPCRCYYADGKRKNPLPAGNHDEDCLTKLHPTITAWARKRKAVWSERLKSAQALADMWKERERLALDTLTTLRGEAEHHLGCRNALSDECDELRRRLAALETEARCNDYWANFQY